MNSSLTDLDVTGKVAEKSGNILGDAHEHLVAAILMRLGFEVALAEVSADNYDCVVVAYEKPPRKGSAPKKIMLKAQIKTAFRNIPFTGGARAGVDRIYNVEGTKPKVYKYTSKMVDLIIGVDRDSLDLYLIPTSYTEDWGKSKSLSKLQPLKNRWEILLNWNPQFLKKLKKELSNLKK